MPINYTLAVSGLSSKKMSQLEEMLPSHSSAEALNQSDATYLFDNPLS